jgi:paraquat-inducible protein A
VISLAAGRAIPEDEGVNETLPDQEELLACPQCDALHRVGEIPIGATARCVRCHTILLAPRRGTVHMLVALALASLILMFVAIGFPFLTLSAMGIVSSASVFDAIRAYSSAHMVLLSFILAMLIVALPLMRILALLYVLTPLMFGLPPLRYAERRFRLAVRLRPWAMAEIFMVGVAVALVKIAGLATVSFGPAFWAFGAVAALLALKDMLMCERTIWRLLDHSRAS